MYRKDLSVIFCLHSGIGELFLRSNSLLQKAVFTNIFRTVVSNSHQLFSEELFTFFMLMNLGLIKTVSLNESKIFHMVLCNRKKDHCHTEREWYTRKTAVFLFTFPIPFFPIEDSLLVLYHMVEAAS